MKIFLKSQKMEKFIFKINISLSQKKTLSSISLSPSFDENANEISLSISLIMSLKVLYY